MLIGPVMRLPARSGPTRAPRLTLSGAVAPELPEAVTQAARSSRTAPAHGVLERWLEVDPAGQEVAPLPRDLPDDAMARLRAYGREAAGPSAAREPEGARVERLA